MDYSDGENTNRSNPTATTLKLCRRGKSWQVAEFGLQLGSVARQTCLGLPLFTLHGGQRPQGLAIHCFQGLYHRVQPLSATRI